MKNLKIINVVNNGRSVANQHIVRYTDNGKLIKIFQSYNSMIIKWINGEIMEVGGDWNYSKTTGKYRNILSGMDKKAFEKMLKDNFKWNEYTQSYIRK